MVRIEHLAAELGWSRKRLWSRFHSQIGLPPKRAAKLVRFDHAVHSLVAGQDAAGVAADGAEFQVLPPMESLAVMGGFNGRLPRDGSRLHRVSQGFG